MKKITNLEAATVLTIVGTKLMEGSERALINDNLDTAEKLLRGAAILARAIEVLAEEAKKNGEEDFTIRISTDELTLDITDEECVRTLIQLSAVTQGQALGAAMAMNEEASLALALTAEAYLKAANLINEKLNAADKITIEIE